MKALMRKERDGLSAEWVRCGRRQAADMGGEELLDCRFFVMSEGVWEPVGPASIPTEVRAGEGPGMLDLLLDKLLDRLESRPEDDQQFAESLRWFGPEMAEEY